MLIGTTLLRCRRVAYTNTPTILVVQPGDGHSDVWSRTLSTFNALQVLPFWQMPSRLAGNQVPTIVASLRRQLKSMVIRRHGNVAAHDQGLQAQLMHRAGGNSASFLSSCDFMWGRTVMVANFCCMASCYKHSENVDIGALQHSFRWRHLIVYRIDIRNRCLNYLPCVQAAVHADLATAVDITALAPPATTVGVGEKVRYGCSLRRGVLCNTYAAKSRN